MDLAARRLGAGAVTDGGSPPVAIPVNNNCEIVSEPERDEQFCHHKHRTQEKVRRVVQKCRLTTFEYLMTDNLHQYR